MSEVDNSPASRVSSSIFLLAPRVLLVKTRLALRVTQGLIATAVVKLWYAGALFLHSIAGGTRGANGMGGSKDWRKDRRWL